MEIKCGDYVTRNSYNNDTIFKVINIRKEVYYLKGVEVRLFADAYFSDLEKVDYKIEEDIIDLNVEVPFERDDYFYLIPKIMHFDGDKDYLKRCLDFYKKSGVAAVGKAVKESDLPSKIYNYLIEYNPDIVIITGHDAYYKKDGSIDDINNYRNSLNFCKAVKNARNFEKSHEKLVIIAGACQSNYEELIKSGANYASSPKRINIHALDPAIIAVTLALTEKSREINLLEMLEKTKYGKDGMGGLKQNGMMYVGYPR